jgi:diguanylate cyclase (GGDEF)-like protein
MSVGEAKSPSAMCTATASPGATKVSGAEASASKASASKTSAKLSRRNRPILSIRARLIVLALLAVGPLMVERVHSLERARAERSEHAYAEAAELAHRGADAQREIIYSTRALLQVVARAYARLPHDPASCRKTLPELSDQIPWIRGLSIATIDGRITCSTNANAAGLNLSDRAYFQEILRTHTFTVSNYVVSRLDQRPALVAAAPALRDDGGLEAIVVASIDLEWIGELAGDAARNADTSVLLFDGRGTLIAASAGTTDLIGRNFADDALVRDLEARDEGTTTAAGLDGRSRLFAFVRVPWTEARLAIGLDESIVHSSIDREISVAYLQLALFGLLVLMGAWFGGEQLIVRPIRSLARTAARFGRGDLEARTSDEPWLAEFEPLAAAFDDMARRLAAREEELRIANQHLDELASLDGLTGLANRRGFDRRLEAEWQRAATYSEPIALMMIDIDHFKLYNDRYGHVAGDACLRAVAEALSIVTLDSAVMVARYGGEEFTLLLPTIDSARGNALGEVVRKAVEELRIVHAEAARGYITVSVGVASLVPDAKQCAADLLEAADRALYIAKRRGRNTVVVHAPPTPLLAAC